MRGTGAESLVVGLQRRTDLSLNELAQWVRPVVRGWVQYYAKFYPSALRCALRTLDHFLVRWARRKYKRLRGHIKRSWGWLKSIRARQPNLFPHWIPWQRLDDRSRMNREVHVRFSEGLGLKYPGLLDTAIPELLKVLDIADCIVIIDAMGTQTKIARTIRERGAHYVLCVKDKPSSPSPGSRHAKRCT